MAETITFVAVDIPAVSSRRFSKHAAVWEALLSNIGRALQFDAPDHRERTNLLMAVSRRCTRGDGLYRARCANVDSMDKPFLIWLESTNGNGGEK